MAENTNDFALSGMLSTCLLIYAALLGLGIAVSGLVEWRKARTDSDYRFIRSVEAVTRFLSGLCIPTAAVAAEVLRGALGDMPGQQYPASSDAGVFPGAETALAILFVAAVSFGCTSLGLSLWRHIGILRSLIRERRREGR